MAAPTTNGVTTALGIGTSGAAMARAVRTGAQPVSALRVAAKIPRIGDHSDLDITAVPTEFTQDLHDTLGNLGEPNDGMDLLLGDMLATIDTDSAGVAASISILGDIKDIAYDAFSAATFAPIVADTATFQASGSKLLAQYNKDVNPPGNPPPPPPPPPPPGGGGGGGGGGNGGGGGGCTWRLRFNKTGDGFVWVWEC